MGALRILIISILHLTLLQFYVIKTEQFLYFLNFFQDWMGQDISSKNFGTLYIGWGSGAGVGSIVKYDGNCQSLRMGRYVAGGLRLKFLLNSQHEMGTISTCMWGSWCSGLLHPPSPQYTDTILKNDIWIGDEALFWEGALLKMAV